MVDLSAVYVDQCVSACVLLVCLIAALVDRK